MSKEQDFSNFKIRICTSKMPKIDSNNCEGIWRRLFGGIKTKNWNFAKEKIK